MIKRLLIFLLFLFAIKGFSQNRYLDSLSKNYVKIHDTMKVQYLLTVSRQNEANDPNKAFSIADSALKIAMRCDYKVGVGGCYGSMGSCLCTSGKYDEAIISLHKALSIFEKAKAKRHITNTYNSLANAFMGMKDNKRAYEYFLKAYNMASEEPRNEFMIAVAGVGVGNMLLEQNEPKKAIEYFKISEKYFHDKGVTNYEAMCITMIGETYNKVGDLKEAERYYSKSLPIFRASNDEYGLAINLSSLAGIQYELKNYNEAEKYYEEALKLNLKRKALDNIQNSAKNLAAVYETQNKTSDALRIYKVYMQYHDSVINVERNKAIAESESKYESEKKEKQLQLKNVELEKSQLEVNQRNHLIYVFAGAIFIFVVLLFFVFRQYNEKKKANVLLVNKNDEIEKQKFIIEEKNKDITDSINYSKHIQQAILPSQVKVKRTLPNSFVLFKPKDIVSGDFYLVEEVVGLAYVAVVDCTGHGVPGAMLSVFANSTIKNTISTNDFRDSPGAILSDLCFQFKSNLQSGQPNTTINDGVDMGICIIDKKNGKLIFSGAKNNLMLLRNNELIEFPASRWGISGANKSEHLFFNDHIIDILPGDKFYLGTDGFIDQFGGPKGKKFKQKQLKDLLIKYSQMSFEEQAVALLNDFEDWKGGLEQIDDVTLIGFEI